MPFFVWNVNSPALYPILIIPALFVIPAQAGINSPQGGEHRWRKAPSNYRRQSRRELDGDFISPSFSRLRSRARESIGDNAKALSAALLQIVAKATIKLRRRSRHSRDCGNPPFCHFSMRDSANGDLSPKMANPCGGKAAPQLSFLPPPTRGQAAAGINCRRVANTDGAKRHLTIGGKAAAN